MSNIQIGIDLGTTNSAVAMLNIDGEVEIVKNTFGSEFTPSVFGVNKAGGEEVGKKPYERYFKDSTPDEIKNNKPEIKRLMGESIKTEFPRIKKSYLPEEISSKTLKQLKEDAARKYDNLNTNAAVITVPAHFNTVQCEATVRAGELAGFKYVITLQEPIAAAISYGFGKEINENWLVYDFGGGTFDCAIISLKDGELSVLGHSGDNFLGGKDIDSAIRDKKILPILKKNHNLTLDEKNDDDKVIFAKLKYAAEQAKIALSSSEHANIEIDIEVDSQNIYENIPISRTELQDLIQDLIDRSIDLCKQCIEETKLQTSAINKIILVGGPTQLPFFKENLKKTLGIEVDTSVDPLTAVAKGACIYATGKTIPEEFDIQKEIDENTYRIKLHYESLTNEESSLVTGEIEDIKGKSDKYFIQIQSKDNTYNSDKREIKDGKFMIDVAIMPKKVNDFWIYLFDNDGNSLKISQESFTITHGVSVSGVPLPKSIGVAISKRDMISSEVREEYFKFFDKNEILPLEKTEIFKTFVEIQADDEENALNITICEGEDPNPKNNFFLCRLSLTGKDTNINIKEGEDVELTIKVDESRRISVEAYLPIIDKSFQVRASTHNEKFSVQDLKDEIKAQNARFKEIENLCDDKDKEAMQKAISNLDNLVQSAQKDEDTKQKAHNQLQELKSQLDKLCQSKGIDKLASEFNRLIKESEKLLNDVSNDGKRNEYRKILDSLKNKGHQAIDENNERKLAATIKEIKDFNGEIVFDNDDIWEKMFNELAALNGIYTNQSLANRLLTQGSEALDSGDMDKVKQCCIGLFNLLPDEFRQRGGGGGSMLQNIAGITK